MDLDLTELLILTATGLALWVGHCLPWHVIPGLTDERGELRRVPAYVYGVGCILAGLAVWCAHTGDWVWLWRVGLLAAAAGAGTILPRIGAQEAERQALEQDRHDEPAVGA